MIPESRIDALYGKAYAECHALASRHYQREENIATGTHALFIEYNKASRDKIDSYIQLVKKGLQIHPKDRQLAYNIYCGLFAELIEKEPMVRTALEEWIIRVGIVDFKEVCDKITDYLKRNGYRYSLLLEHNLIKTDATEESKEWELPDRFLLGVGSAIKQITHTGTGVYFYEGAVEGIHIRIQFTKTTAENIVKDVKLTIDNDVAEFPCKTLSELQCELEERFISCDKEGENNDNIIG